MKITSLVLIAVSMVVSIQANADVTLNKSQLNVANKNTNHHRYDRDIGKLDNDSSTITYRIMNRDRLLTANESSGNDNLQVKLFKK